MKYFSYAILIFFCVIGLASIHQVDKERMWNITESSLNNAFNNASLSFQINPNATSFEDILINIVFKIADAGIYVMKEVTIIAAKLAIENPQINFKLILWIVILSLLFPLVLGIAKLCALFYVLIKDIIDERKYKKQINNLKIEKEVKNV